MGQLISEILASSQITLTSLILFKKLPSQFLVPNLELGSNGKKTLTLNFGTKNYSMRNSTVFQRENTYPDFFLGDTVICVLN